MTSAHTIKGEINVAVCRKLTQFARLAQYSGVRLNLSDLTE